MKGNLKKDNYEFREETTYKKTKKNLNKIIRIISDVLFYIMMVAMVLFSLNFAVDTSVEKSVFGYRIFNVLTSSMDSVIPRGSLIVVKVIDKKDIQIGDDITFYSNPTTSVTHRVTQIYEDYQGSGVTAFQTKGVDNQKADKDVALAPNVVGKVVWHIPILGFALDFVSKNLILVLAIMIFITLLSLSLRVYFNSKREEENCENK